MDINKLWYKGNESDWEAAINSYRENPSVKRNLKLETKMDEIDYNRIRDLSVEDFYQFLHDEYFVWKYTAKNRLATTSKQLERYKTEGMCELDEIQRDIFTAFTENPNNTKELLKKAMQIHGLGAAGASGLLAILFPKHYGTIDQFLVYSLRKLNLSEQSELEKMKPEGLTLNNGIILENILRRKSNELNKKFGTTKWNPKKVDMVLWTYREGQDAYNKIEKVIEENVSSLTEEERQKLSDMILKYAKN